MHSIITILHTKNVELLEFVKNDLQTLIMSFKQQASQILNMYANRDLYEEAQVELITYMYNKLQYVTRLLDSIFINIHLSTDQQTLYTYSVNKQLVVLLDQIKYTIELLRHSGGSYDNYTGIVIKTAICCENIAFYYNRVLKA